MSKPIIWPFGSITPMTRKRPPAIRTSSPSGLRSPNSSRASFGPSTARGAAAARVALRPERALARAEAPEGGQVGCRAEDADAAAALARLDPSEAHRDGHDGLDAGDPLEGLGVVDRQLARRAPEDAGDAERLRLAGVDGEDVRAELGELRQHVDARALADRGQQDDRGDPDRDPEHREQRAQAVGPKGPGREAQEVAHRLTVPPSAATGSSRVARRAGSDAEDGTDRHREGEGRDDRPQRRRSGQARGRGRRGRRTASQPAARPRTPPAVEMSTASARKASEDLPPPGAERLQQPDLARPLGDRDEHHVHDADPGHRERDAGDAGEGQGEGAEDRGEGAEHRVLGDGGDVLLAVALRDQRGRPAPSRGRGRRGCGPGARGGRASAG